LANRANCANEVANVTSKGSFTGSASPYGTFDQGGNVWEWNETIISSGVRGFRGGAHGGSPLLLGAAFRFHWGPSNQDLATGFRVAMIPEPSTGLLAIAGLLGLAGWRRRSA
jgi:MYXO-CTERM domain-containing protein